MQRTRRLRQPRAVIDTNLFISAAINRRGQPHELLLAWRSRAFILIISEEQQAELADVISRPAIAEKYSVSNRERTALLRRINRRATKTNPAQHIPLVIRDVKDEKILAAALGGNADYLVTGDNDLLVLRNSPELGNLKIVTASEFLQVLLSS